MLENRNINSHILNLQFNRHSRAHLYRAALEGVAFSFVQGVNILKDMGIYLDIMRVGNDNMFQSRVFSSTIATLLNCRIEVVDTTGAIGAARAAGVAAGAYGNLAEALEGHQPTAVYDPASDLGLYKQAYQYWTSQIVDNFRILYVIVRHSGDSTCVVFRASNIEYRPRIICSQVWVA